MSIRHYDQASRLRELWDDEAVPRTYTAWNESGAIIETRGYTPEENARADAEAAEGATNVNRSALIAKAAAALQANIADIPAIQTLAEGNGFQNNTQRDSAIRGLAARVLTLHRQNNALIRVVSGLLSSQDGS